MTEDHDLSTKSLSQKTESLKAPGKRWLRCFQVSSNQSPLSAKLEFFSLFFTSEIIFNKVQARLDWVTEAFYSFLSNYFMVLVLIIVLLGAQRCYSSTPLEHFCFGTLSFLYHYLMMVIRFKTSLTRIVARRKPSTQVTLVHGGWLWSKNENFLKVMNSV